MDDETNSQTPAFVNGYLGQVLRESTIHGVKYIGLPNRHMVERVFWIIAVLALFGFSIYLVEDVYTKFFANPIIISFQPMETDISQVPFPAITLCNVNILKRKRALDIFDKLVEEAQKVSDANLTTSEEYVNSLILSEHLAHYCLAAPSFRRVLSQPLVDSFGDADFVEQVHDYLEKYISGDYMNIQDDEMSDSLKHNVSNFLNDAAHECEDMILKCMWARKEIECSEIFFNIHTSHGSCCVFNMMPRFILMNIPENDTRAEREKKMWPKGAIKEWKKFGKSGQIVDFDEVGEVHYPRHQHSGGKPYGLSILINPEIDKYGTCNTNDAWGFKMIAHSPITFPAISDYGVAVPPNSEVFVDIEPTLSVAKNGLKDIPIDKRGCYFPTDQFAKDLNSYKFYTGGNCMDECIANITYEKCECVRYFMPKNSTQKLCGAKKLKCAEEVRENLTRSGRSGHCKLCKPACTEIKYRLQLSHFPLRENKTMPYIYYNTSSEANKTAINYTVLHVYFGTDKVYAKERKALYDASDLLANAGGLLSLTLGFSIVSIVEVVYFCTLRAWFHFKSQPKDDEDGSSSDDQKPKPTAVVRPRIQDGLQTSTEKPMVGYYNWAMTTTTNATKVIVKPKQAHAEAPSPEGISRRKVSAFQFLQGKNKDQCYPYLN